MLTLRKTQFTFVALNQCGVILPDTSTLILLLFKDIRSNRHLRTIGKSIIGLGIRQRHSLNCSKDDGFSLFNPFAALANLSEQQDKAVCNRYTLIHKIIGTCKSHRHRWGAKHVVFRNEGFFFFLFFACFSFWFCFVRFFSLFFCCGQLPK